MSRQMQISLPSFISSTELLIKIYRVRDCDRKKRRKDDEVAKPRVELSKKGTYHFSNREET